ncbi:MAG: DNA alkylation repair protein [Flavobacteriales bacterium]
MAAPLKEIFNEAEIRRLAKIAQQADGKFSESQFIAKLINRDWKHLELKQRMRRVAEELGQNLKGDFAKQSLALRKIAPQFSGLFGMSFPDYVEVYGKHDPELSLELLEFLTPFSSSEFAIRPFLLNEPDLTIKTMMKWSKSKNHHVRRLASEGSRPRLPWAMAIPFLKKDPDPILPILYNLKNDKEDYVYRSVANNLNDISKDNPAITLRICKEWKDGPEETQWVIKHALRTLLKKGDPAALKLQGHHHTAPAEIHQLRISANEPIIGTEISFSCELKNPSSKPHLYRVEYGIEYVKSNGKTSQKVFQWKKINLPPGESVKLNSKQSLADMSTRKHYPGIHTLHVLINGKSLNNKVFKLVNKGKS